MAQILNVPKHHVSNMDYLLDCRSFKTEDLRKLSLVLQIDITVLCKTTGTYIFRRLSRDIVLFPVSPPGFYVWDGLKHNLQYKECPNKVP